MATELSRLLVVVGAKTEEFGKAFKDIEKQIASTERKLDGFTKIGERFKKVGLAISAAVTLPLVGLGAAAIKTSVDLESAFAGVRKTVDGTEEEFAALKQQFDDMAKRIPIAVTEIYRIGEAAGQLGVKKENIIGFAEVMAKLGVATNMSSDQAATALARLANITQMPQENFDRLGATVVALGNNLATTESEIVEMGLRLAGAGKQVGLTEAQVLGFAGALSSVGIEAEMGGSAFSRVFLDMQNAVMSGRATLGIFAQVAGMSTQQFALAFKENAAGAVAAFIEGLGKVSKSGQNVVPVLEALGLSEIRVRDSLLRAANAGDLFRSSIELGTKAWKENTALNKEANERFKTSASQFQILKNQLTLLGGAFGGILTPALLTFLKPFVAVIDSMSKMNESTKKVVGIVLLLAAGIGPLLFSIGLMIKMVPILTLGIKGLGMALAWLNANPLGALITLIGAAIVIMTLMYQNMDKLRYYGLQAFKSLKIGVMSAVKSMLTSLGEFLGLVPGLSGKINNAIKNLENQIESDKEFKVNLAINYEASQEAEKIKNEIAKVTSGNTGTTNIPGIVDVPQIELPAEKTAKKIATAWTNTSDALKNAFSILVTGHESAALKAEMHGDKLAQMSLKGQQLTEQMTSQQAIIAKVKEEITANTAAGVLQDETQEDLAKRTDELNKKLADEEKALVDLKKQLYDNNQAVKTQAKELRELGEEVTKVETKYREDLTSALEDYQKKVKETNNRLIDDEKKLTEEYDKALDSRAKSLADFVGLFDAVTPKSVSGSELLANLKGQVKTFEDWSANIQALSARGVDQGLIEELRQMGPKAAPEIAALLTLTDSELQEYQTLWRTKTADARNEAIIQLEQQRIEMQTKLTEIRTAATQQLELYKVEWEKKNADIRKNADEEMTRIQKRFEEISGAGTKYGVELVANFTAGMESRFESLRKTLEKMAGLVDSYMPHSPAKVGPLKRLAEWGPSLVKTFAEGIRFEMPSLRAVTADLAGMVSPIVNVAPAVSMGSPGAAGPVTINVYGNNADEIMGKLKRDLARAGVRLF